MSWQVRVMHYDQDMDMGRYGVGGPRPATSYRNAMEMVWELIDSHPGLTLEPDEDADSWVLRKGWSGPTEYTVRIMRIRDEL